MIARPLAEHFRRLLGPAGVIDDPAAMAPYGVDRTTRYRPAPGLVVRPATVEEVAAVVRLARAEGLPLVPSGGRTGYAGGAVAAAGEVVVSLERMRRIAHFSPQDAAVTCEAGVVTAELQAFAERQNLFYPVDLASAGSCQIGGNAATNAGGVHVIRYGGTREQVTGLTVVTGTGEVLRLNRGLVKNNAGPDLRHLFVGSEGILGILCEVTVRLAPPRPPQWVLLAAAPDVEALLAFAAAARRALVLSACEFFSEAALQRVRARSGLAHPFARPAPLYGLLEFDAPPDGGEVEELFAAARGYAWLEDAVLATEPGQARRLWRLREEISEALAPSRPLKFDLAVRLERLAELGRGLAALFRERFADLEAIWFGHLGDGNVHLNVPRPATWPEAAWLERSAEVEEAVVDLVLALDGSLSAEHGIGLAKRHLLPRFPEGAALTELRALKRTFDPDGILNPGKVLPPESSP